MEHAFRPTVGAALTALALVILATFPANAAPRQQTVANICDRTPEVEAVILAEVTGATCSTITDAQLAAIVRSLLIEGYSSPTLLSSDFAGLTGVNFLTISASPDLDTVPANAFSEMPHLRDLHLTDNAIDTLHPNAFGDLSELEALNLTNNHIKILEEGVFSGLSSLTSLVLQKNALAEVNPGVFDALTSLTYLALQSNNIADLDAGTFNKLTGLTSLILSENELSSVHADLFDGLTSLQYLSLDYNELSGIDADLFDGLTSLQHLYFSNNELSSVDTDLFDGLTNLQYLDLDGNELSSVDADLFDGLTSLLELSLDGNELSSVDADLFDGLTSLQKLRLHNNELSSVDADLFDGLTNLLWLLLHDNSISTLPATVFDGLTSLQWLRLDGNDLSGVHVDLFDGLTSLRWLYLYDNSISTLPATVFDEPTSLSYLWLYDNDLTSLDADLFGSLTSLNDLDLHGNNLSSLDADLFDGLTNLQYLLLDGNELTSLDADLFDGLTNLLWLFLHDNELTSLDADLFDGLTGLQRLRLDGNEFTTVDAALFDGPTSLQRLYLHDNSIATLPANAFDALASLQFLYLTGNSIATLPANVFAGLTGLASLDLSCNSLTALDLSRFNPFATILTYLDISGNSFTMEPTDAAVRAKLTNTGLILYTGTNTDCHLPTDIGLSALTTSEGELDPPFEAPGSTGGYGLHVDHDVTSITVSPTPNDPEASIRPDSDADPNTAGIQFNLSGAQNRVEWYVDAKNGLFAQMYLIDVYRAHPPGRYVLLRSLTLSGATLEDFDSRAYTYTASVPTTVTETTVTTTPFDPDATTVVKLNGVTDSDGTVSLAVGDNVIKVEVAAEDGITTETYTVTVKRAAPSAPAPPTTDSNRVVYVPNNWSLKPAGIDPGVRFRLIFLSSTKRDATSTDIETYNTFVQDLAANGHANIEDHSSRFRVVGCTASTDARDNTRTTTRTARGGVPIYWLGGNKVADNYTDFYDGTWDDEANDKNESGNDAHDTSQAANFPFTGCRDNGTEATGAVETSALGSLGLVRLGRPDSTDTNHSPIGSDANEQPDTTRPFYALSPVFQVPTMNAYTLSKGGVPHPGKINSDNDTGNYHQVRLYANVSYRIDVKGNERSQPGGTIRNPRVRIDAGSGKLKLLNRSSDGVSQTSSVTTALRGGATSSSGTNSRLEIKVKAEQTGTYRLLVYRAAGDDGTYTITINERDWPQGRLAPDITVTQENSASVSFSWTKPKKTHRSITAPIQSYQVQYRPFPNGRWSTEQTLSKSVLDHQFTGLSSGQSYDVRVRSYHPDSPYMTYQWGYARVYTTN